jgi:amino acid transporter
MGAAAPLAYLVVGGATGAVALCFASAGSRVPTSGGAYGFIEAAFGPFVGFLMGFLLLLGCVLAAGGIAAAIADNAARLSPVLAGPLPRALIILGLFSGFAAVNILGVRPGARLVGAITLVKLVPIALLLVLAAPHVHPANLKPGHIELSGFGRAMLLAAFAFQGMEGAMSVSGEVRRPERNIPRAILGSLAIVALLYVAIQLVTQGVLGPALAASKTPLADAAAAVSPALFALLIAGAGLSQLGYLSGDTLTAPRLMFAFACDGFLPRPLAALHPKTRAPFASILAYDAIACVLALTGGFTELVTLASLASVVLYMTGCAAAVALQRRGVAHAGKPFAFRALPVAAAVGLAGMTWVAFQASRAEMIGSVITLVLASGWYVVARRLRGFGRSGHGRER